MIKDLTVVQLHRAIAIKEQIEALEQELSLVVGNETPIKSGRRKYGMSAAGRARIAAAQRARWAKAKSAEVRLTAQPKKGKRKMSAAGRAAISAAAKARWAKIKAQGKSRL